MADLQLFLDKVVAPDRAATDLALCHSMGAHIMMRVLAENGSGPLSAGVLCSPMTALQARGDAAVGADADARDCRRSTSATCSGPARSWCSPASSAPISSPTTSAATASPTSGSQADPRLALGGPTLGWGRQAVRSMTRGRGAGLPRAHRAAAGADHAPARIALIDQRSHDAGGGAGSRHGEHFTIARRASTKSMMETDELRGPVLGSLRPAGERRAGT